MSHNAWRTGNPPRDAVIRACAVVGVTGFVAVALLGAAVSSVMTVLVLGPALAALLAGFVAVTADGPLRSRAALRVLVPTAGFGLLLLPFVAGLRLLGVVGAVVALALLAVAGIAGVACCGTRHRSSRPRPPGAAVGATSSEAAPGTSVATKPTRDFIRLLQTRRLLEEWRSSSAHLQGGDPLHRLEAVQLRALLLEELSRRHPEAVDRWLAHGGDDDLHRHIGDDRNLAG